MNATMGARAGYWGPVTASVDWCEHNYVVTEYVAEFFNTLSGVPMMLLPAYAMYWGQHCGYSETLYFNVACVASMMVGFGTMLFHGTLTMEGQVLDEVPMLWAICSYAACVEISSERPKRWVPYAAAAWAVSATLVYCLVSHIWFCWMFFGSVVCTIFLAREKNKQCTDAPTRLLQEKLVKCAGSCYIGSSLFFWIPDILLCGNRLQDTHDIDHVQGLHLHALFHLSAAGAVYSFLCYAAVLQSLKNKKKAELAFNRCSQPIPIIVARDDHHAVGDKNE